MAPIIVDPEGLKEQGYGWKRITVKCCARGCDWKGRRIWGPNMSKKPCPRCGTLWNTFDGPVVTSVSAPTRVKKR
jgi:hypothetical protein